MNKTAIKNFAIWARNKLIAEITYKAGLYGITDAGIAPELPASTAEIKFYDIGTKEPVKVEGKEVSMRKSLAAVIERKAKELKYKEAFEYVIEEVAYTWFNRLIAVRFMEVNEYLPSGIRVLSSEMQGKNEPDMVSSPFDTDIDFTDADRAYMTNLKDDELFRFLFIKQCNKLNEVLPELFEKTDNYTELLLTLSFTDTDSVVYHLVHDIDEEDFNLEKDGQVEIIGWMYQFYNTSKNEMVYDGSLSKDKIPKELISAATTIYTPDWSVKYMVENSLGQLWNENVDDFDTSLWKYYVTNKKSSNVISKYNSPEEIKFFDPCMGSGHILVYAFDVFMQIYLSQGYTERDASALIITNNLYGADLDKRAYQLSYFVLMMKARAYDRRFLSRNIEPNLCNYQELNGINTDSLCDKLHKFADEFINADTIGSLIQIDNYDIEEIENAINSYDEDIFSVGSKDYLKNMLKVYKIISIKYDVVVTNPPYLGGNRFCTSLSNYVNSKFQDEKSDLSMAMFKQAISFYAKEEGYISFITSCSWFFLASFEKLRNYILNNFQFESIVDYGSELFEGKVGHVPIVSWVLKKEKNHKPFVAIRLVDYCFSRRNEKHTEFFNPKNRYLANQADFCKIPSSPIVYWVSENFFNTFDQSKKIGEISNVKKGLSTGDNNKFLRLWYEVETSRILFGSKEYISPYKWVPLNKGGYFRKWYGNNEYVINWYENGQELKNYKGSVIRNESYYFNESLTWTMLTTASLGIRYSEYGKIFEGAGPSLFSKKNIFFILGILGSSVGNMYIRTFNPTMNINIGDICNIPIKEFDSEVIDSVECIVKDNVSLSKFDWDSFETSWDFVKHPLIRDKLLISNSFKEWNTECDNRFNTLKSNEEELNRIFIDIYGLQDELTPEVEDKDVTVRKADLTRDIKSFISYAVGCMFGRYSLDVNGLAYAGGDWDDSKYKSFIPVKDNCIIITDEEFFSDDIVNRFVEFVKTVYGEDTLEENLDFVADALGNKGTTSRQKIRNYFLSDFIKDHNKIYQKRPIYWMFDSGKQNGFKALVYMHRWNADTIGNVRVEYLHKLQRVYESEINRMQETIDNSANSKEIANAEKRKDKLSKQQKEAREYDEKISHLALMRTDIDLDDGVKVNYEKVQTAQDGRKLEVLVKI